MRTFDRKEVYSSLNAEDARSYINKEGYFADTLSILNEQVRLNRFEILDDVKQLQDFPFITCGKCSLFFLPVDKVKEIEKLKKYRPFKTIQEFKNTLCGIDFNEPIQLRYKNNHNNSIMTIFTGYEELNNELIAICLGACILVPENGFNDFEVYNNKTEEWQPFGILENE